MASKNYINNKTFYTELVKYNTEYDLCVKENKPLPRVSEYIGKCIWLIAERLATKRNFSGYSYIDEMKSDGIEDCFKYLRTFDPNKSTQAFGYFTQAIKFAFIRRINEEKKLQYIKLQINSLIKS